jgi:hypothetical protein
MEIVQPGPQRPVESAPTPVDLADRVAKRVATAIVVAGALVGLAIYWKPAPNPNRFEAFVANGEVFRINTKTGTILACDPTRCMTVVQRGQHLMSYKQGKLFQGQPAAAPAALPARAPASGGARPDAGG